MPKLRLSIVLSATLMILIAGFTPMAVSQTITFAGINPGQALIYDGSSTLTTDPLSVVDVYVDTLSDSTHDFCGKINEVWSTTLNAVIDARGFSGAQSCSSNPIPSSAKGVLLLGSYTITTNAEWVIPNGVEVRGLGTSNSSAANTVLKAGASFTAADNTVVKLGATGGDSEAKIDNLTVDCNSGSGNTCVYGIMNIDAINNSWVQNVVIQNASNVGLLIEVSSPGSGGADSGTYQGVTIQYTQSSCCSSSTIGVELLGTDDGTLVRGLDDLTISGCGLSSSAKFGIYIDQASTKIVNASIQCFQTGIQIGCSSAVSSGCSSTTTTHDVQADSVYYYCTNGSHCTTGTAGVGIAVNPSGSSDGPAQNVTLTNISGSDSTNAYVANLIKDSDVGAFSNSVFEGALLLGDSSICTGCLAVVSSDPSVPWQTPSIIP